MKYTSNYMAKVDPNEAFKELNRINQKYKGLKPQIVVDESLPEDAPLHPVFEWDDEIAGNEWRKSQARNLIKDIRVVTSDNKPPQRVFVSIKDDEGRESTYYPLQQIVATPEMRSKMMAQCMAELVAIKAKYTELSNAVTFAPVFAEIGKLELQQLA